MPIRGCRLIRTDSSPSEVSSSEMPDSSSSSISFFTLRISIREPLQNFVLRSGQAGDGGLQGKLIADRTQSVDGAAGNVGHIKVMSIRLARAHNAQGDF